MTNNHTKELETKEKQERDIENVFYWMKNQNALLGLDEKAQCQWIVASFVNSFDERDQAVFKKIVKPAFNRYRAYLEDCMAKREFLLEILLSEETK